MATRRRWLQFSLRGFIAILTIGCVWLGWKVERALRRGRAINALVESGRPVLYLNPPHEELRPEPGVDHFWPDLRHNPVRVFFEVPLNEKLCQQVSRTRPVGRIDLIGEHTDEELQYLDERLDGCRISIHSVKRLTGTALAQLQERLPHSTVEFVVRIQHKHRSFDGQHLVIASQWVQFHHASQPELKNGGVITAGEL